MLTIIQSDALSALRDMPDKSIQCCVTSPPYWGLRDYGLEPTVWDQTVECDHAWGASVGVRKQNPRSNLSVLADKYSPRKNPRNPSNYQTEDYAVNASQGAFCAECGAWCGCLGLEPTPDLYVSHLVQIFCEMKRVLRSDGTLWLNLGDSYATGGGDQGERSLRAGMINTQPNRMPLPGLKSKDLIGIPWRVAFALQADGWYLRSDVIWSKPNPMPESVTDRPTRAHEYIFLLSKGRSYYYDAEAIKEPATMALAYPDGNASTITGGNHSRHTLGEAIPAKERRSDKQRGHSRRHAGFNDRWDAMGRTEQCSGMRNKRSVWEIATKPFPDAHFATFPPDLIKPCILAGAEAGAVVIDPFGGSGTTGKVAIELGRKAILIEPKAEYIEMIKRRCETTIGLPLH